MLHLQYLYILKHDGFLPKDQNQYNRQDEKHRDGNQQGRHCAADVQPTTMAPGRNLTSDTCPTLTHINPCRNTSQSILGISAYIQVNTEKGNENASALILKESKLVRLHFFIQ